MAGEIFKETHSLVQTPSKLHHPGKAKQKRLREIGLVASVLRETEHRVLCKVLKYLWWAILKAVPRDIHTDLSDGTAGEPRTLRVLRAATTTTGSYSGILLIAFLIRTI